MKTKYKMEGGISMTYFIFCILMSILAGLIGIWMYNKIFIKKPATISEKMEYYNVLLNQINGDPHLDEYAKNKKKNDLAELILPETTTATTAATATAATATLNGGTTK